MAQQWGTVCHLLCMTTAFFTEHISATAEGLSSCWCMVDTPMLFWCFSDSGAINKYHGLLLYFFSFRFSNACISQGVQTTCCDARPCGLVGKSSWTAAHKWCIRCYTWRRLSQWWHSCMCYNHIQCWLTLKLKQNYTNVNLSSLSQSALYICYNDLFFGLM